MKTPICLWIFYLHYSFCFYCYRGSTHNFALDTDPIQQWHCPMASDPMQQWHCPMASWVSSIHLQPLLELKNGYARKLRHLLTNAMRMTAVYGKHYVSSESGYSGLCILVSIKKCYSVRDARSHLHCFHVAA